MKKWLLAIVLITILSTGVVIALHKPETKAVTTPTSLTKYENDPAFAPATPDTLLVAVNTERAKYHAAPLTLDPRLQATAQAKANDETTRHYYSHPNPEGIHGTALMHDALGVNGYYDENLAEPSPQTVDEVMNEWKLSKPHHDGMINPHYTITGFGISGSNFVEDFYGPL